MCGRLVEDHKEPKQTPVREFLSKCLTDSANMTKRKLINSPPLITPLITFIYFIFHTIYYPKCFHTRFQGRIFTLSIGKLYP